MGCLFCKIINKEIKAEIVFENENSVAVLDIFPRAPGHTMVLPKTHAENIIDLPEKEIEGVFMAVKEVTKRIEKALSPDGFTIGINHGRNAGQAIDHLHIHIIPRYKGDGGGSIHTVVDNAPKETIEEIKSKILSYK